MTTTLNAVDFAFRPIRPEEDYSGMDCGDGLAGQSSAPAGGGDAGTFRDYGDSAGFDDDDLFISDGETLPDATGFGARQREINEQQRTAAAAAERAVPGPFLGSTLRELCDSYGALAAAASTPPSVWAEVLATLREREETKTPWTLDPATARHMKYRATLIEWILEVCADFGFGPTTADLAVQYMDRVLSKVNVPKTSLQLVAMCCLEVAVKYEEVEQDVPSLPKLRRCASNVYSVEIIRKMELAVLIELDWDLAAVVPAHFLEAILALTGGGTFPHDDVGDKSWTPDCSAQLRKLAGYLHSICLQDSHVATRVPASQLAAAIVATARLQLNIYPVWPAELRVAAGYECDVLGSTMSQILRLYKEALPASEVGVGHGGEQGGVGVGAEGAPEGMMDAVMRALDGEASAEKGAFAEGSRDFLTPSPTGPLDAAAEFFDDFETETSDAMVEC